MMHRLLLALALVLTAGAATAQQSAPDAVNGGIYLSSQPTLTNRQTAPFQMDANGNLRVTSTGGSSTTPSIVAVIGNQVAPVSKSGTITLGATAQSLMAANAARRGCEVQNVSNADLWIYELGTASAAQPSKWLPAGAYYLCPPTGIPVTAWSIFGATTGQAFMAREW